MPQTKPAPFCPTCGGERNVTNIQCSRCYMREYRKTKKIQVVTSVGLERELLKTFGHPLAWPRILSNSAPIREYGAPSIRHNTCYRTLHIPRPAARACSSAI